MNGWINVKDRLPKKGKKVVIYSKVINVYDPKVEPFYSLSLAHYCCTSGWDTGYAGFGRDRIPLYWSKIPSTSSIPKIKIEKRKFCRYLSRLLFGCPKAKE